MSAFLGPIHFWLYHKIQIQQSILEEIIKISEDYIPDIREELDTRYELSETRPLEEVIDEGNIHGWLQYRVSQVEYKLAFCVTSLLDKNKEILPALEKVFAKKGEEIAFSQKISDAKDAYKAISDSLLDGMPCDHANILVEESDDKIIWRRNTCVHQKYWDEVGGNIDIYYLLREAFIRGGLMGTSLNYEKVDDVTNMIVRRNGIE